MARIPNALRPQSRVLSLLRSEYYVWNVLVLASYALFRQRHSDSAVSLSTPKFLPAGMAGKSLANSGYAGLEMQVAAALLISGALRSYRSSSADAIMSTMLSFSQLFVLIMAAFTEPVSGPRSVEQNPMQAVHAADCGLNTALP